MAEKNVTDKNLEQNDTSGGLDTFIESELAAWQKHELDALERVSFYPATFEEYSELPLTERLTAASGLYLAEAPRMGRGANEMPKNPLIIDISSLTGKDIDYAKARIAYGEGDWTNAVNDTYVTQLPHIRIDVEVAKDNLRVLRKFAELQIRQDYYGGGYTQYRGSKNNFIAVKPDRVWKPTLITDYDDPFFQDIVKVLDIGIENIYQTKIEPRTKKLGAIALEEAE